MAEATAPQPSLAQEPELRRRQVGREQGSDLWLLAAVVALMTLGLLMVYSSTYALSYYNFDGVTNWYLLRQITWAMVGGVALIIFWRLDYHCW
nr:FtsW/RodA/SpoVE family cell cycle protein [Ardenticatenales bacterium]